MSNMFTKHRFLSKRLFLSLLILAFYPPLALYAGWINDGEYEYIYEGNSDKLTVKNHFDDKASEVTIPTTVVYRGKTYYVNRIGELAFQEHKNLTEITIPDCIEDIGACAFYGCTGITSIHIPETVKRIDDFAFKNCSSLATVNLPNGLEMLGAGIFDGTAWMTAQTENTVYLNNYLIKASGSGDFVLAAGTAGIAGGNIGAFTTFDMSPAEGTLRFIGNRALYCHTNITSIEIPESVTRIGRSAFSSCTNLETVTVNGHLVEVGNHAFHNTKFYENAAGLVIASNAVVGYSGSSDASVTIPDGITLIGDAAIEGATLTSLTIPGSVVSLGRCAFYGSKIGTLTLPATISDYHLGYDYAWWTYGGDYTYGVVDDAHYIYYDYDPYQSMNVEQFSYYDSTAPFTLSEIGKFVLTGVGNLTLENGILYDDGKTCLLKASEETPENVVLPSTVTYISFSAFYKLTLTNREILPKGLQIIGGKAFYSGNVETIDIPSSVKYIGYEAFFHGNIFSNKKVSSHIYFHGKYPPVMGKLWDVGRSSNPVYMYVPYYCNEHIDPDAVKEMKILLQWMSLDPPEIGDKDHPTMKQLYNVFSNYQSTWDGYYSAYKNGYDFYVDLPDRYFTRIPVSSVGYATAYLPYVSVVPEGVEAYEGGEVTTDGEIKLMRLKKVEDFDDEEYTEEVDDPEHPGEKITKTKTRKVAAAENTIAANEGVVIKASEGTYSFDERETDVTPTTGGEFKLPGQACHDIAKPNGDIFTLTKKYATGEHPVTFARYTGNSMRAYASWWEKPASLQAKYIVFMFPEEDLAIETGLHNGSSPFCNQKTGNAPLIFDINGRQLLSKPANGLYIINGKKIFKR